MPSTSANVAVNKLLVGHGLTNDLKVLRLTLPWFNIRETSLCKPFISLDYFGLFHPRCLRDLAKFYMGVLIQQVNMDPQLARCEGGNASI